MIDTSVFFNHVGGSTSKVQCDLLFELGKQASDEGPILDLNCNYGRSTISLCLGMADGGNRNGKVVAWDPHRSEAGTGTLISFITNLTRYSVQGRVIPVIQTHRTVLELFNKRSVSLIAAQMPPNLMHDSLVSIAKTSSHILRKGGVVAVLKSMGASADVFTVLCSTLFSSELGFEEESRGDGYQIYNRIS